MAAYPITSTDSANLLDALNYAVSGPAGIGQQLTGFNSYTATNLNGNVVTPYVDAMAVLYVPKIDISDSTWLDDYTRQYTFAAAEPTPPFALGNGILIENVTPNEFNTPYDNITGLYSTTAIVVECTTGYVIIRDTVPIPNPGPGTGGTASYFITDRAYDGTKINTDAVAPATVDASNSLVSITAQLQLAAATYAVFWLSPNTVSPHEIKYTVQLNRYRAVNVGTVAEPLYDYNFDAPISEQQVYSQTLTAATQGIPLTYTILSGTPAVGSAGLYNFPNGNPLGGGNNGDGAYGGFDINIINDLVDYATGSTVTALGNGGNYVVGEQVTVSGADLGGLTPDNDLVMAVATIGGTGDVTVGPFDVVFTTIYDQPTVSATDLKPASGLYQYRLQINVFINGDDLIAAKSITVGRRSISARVVKQ